MSFDEEYYTHLEEYYNDMLTSKNKKYSKCEGCKNDRKFIIKSKDDTLQLIYTCGSNTDKKCGPIFQLTLPKYINYNNDYTYLYNKINNETSLAKQKTHAFDPYYIYAAIKDCDDCECVGCHGGSCSRSQPQSSRAVLSSGWRFLQF